ncbi:MAG: calcium/sodium antiporter [Gammaproteobacteria bacterium]|nr:calcium/sodium antiporter [Gammaproteobacteria bacterium]
MFLSIVAILVGLATLVWSADRFVDGAAAIAQHLGVSNLIIGITVVGFGTSAPEIAVSVIAVLDEVPGIAVGNAIGSNIANIGLILGITALLAPISVSKGLIRSEYPLLFGATAVLVWCLYDLQLDRLDGFVLLSLLAVIMAYMIHSHRNAKVEIDDDENDEPMSSKTAWLWILLGLVLLIGSSRMLVWGASNIAHSLGVSELVIGLTIVALGTSLPELAASIASLKKSIADMAIGNVIGSNLFNSLAVVGIPPLIHGFEVDIAALHRDLPVMVVLTLLLFALSFGGNQRLNQIGRYKGAVLFASFAAYQCYLYFEVVSGESWFS